MPAMRFNDIVAARMRQVRLDRGLSQEQLGEKLTGIHGKRWWPQAVSAAEKGRRMFTVEDLAVISLALQYPITLFFEPSEPEAVITVGKEASLPLYEEPELIARRIESDVRRLRKLLKEAR